MRPIFLLSAMLLLSYASKEQTAISAKTYHKHYQSCHYLGTVEYDYLLQLRDDSTILYIVYSTSYKSEYKTVVKEVYTGQYSVSNDTLQVLLTACDSFSTKKGDSTQYSSFQTNKPISIGRKLQFILAQNDLVPINTYIPILNKTSALKSDWLSAKFEYRQ